MEYVAVPFLILCHLMRSKQFLLAVTNKNEGNDFVDANETLTITDYVSRLFPDMTSFQVQEAASIYQEYGTSVEQAIMVMGDCESRSCKSGRSANNLMYSYIYMPHVLPAEDICWFLMEGRSPFPCCTSHHIFDVTLLGALCRPARTSR